MTFSATYNCIQNPNQKWTSEDHKYSIIPIRYKDRFDIMKWRNEQIYHLRQKELLTKENQDHYFKNIVSEIFNEKQPDQILFSYLENDVCVGYGGLVHINWHDKNAEISFIMDTKLEEKYFHLHWRKFLNLLEKVAFNELLLHKIYTYAFDLRKHLYKILEKSNYKKEAVLKDQYLFNNKFYSVVIHSKINNNYKLELRKANMNDAKLLFDWVNEKKVRINSLNSEEIDWTNHIKWLESSLNSPETKIYILKNKNINIGQIRIEFDNNNWKIDYSIDINYRQNGFGTTAIKLILERHPSFNFIAVVKKSNKASSYIFEKLEFIKVSDSQSEYNIYEKRKN